MGKSNVHFFRGCQKSVKDCSFLFFPTYYVTTQGVRAFPLACFLSRYGGGRPTERLACAVFVGLPPFCPHLQCGKRVSRVEAKRRASVSAAALDT